MKCYALQDVKKKQRPLICYAGSAVETSIGPKPIGDELNLEFYLGRTHKQARHASHRELTTQGEQLYQEAHK